MNTKYRLSAATMLIAVYLIVLGSVVQASADETTPSMDTNWASDAAGAALMGASAAAIAGKSAAGASAVCVAGANGAAGLGTVGFIGGPVAVIFPPAAVAAAAGVGIYALFKWIKD